MAEGRAATACVVVFCGLAVLSSLGPQADAVATTIAVALLGLGALAGIVGWAVHVRRVRREVGAGRGMRWRRVDQHCSLDCATCSPDRHTDDTCAVHAR